MAKRSERRRVSREDVRRNAEKGGQRGQNWFQLPEGVREWVPEKAGAYLLDFLPYEVSDKQHPDGVEQGTLWYKRPFMVHHNVGPQGESLVCPTTVGKPCPMCEHRAKLAKDYERNKEAIVAVNPQRFVAYNIADPDDAEAVAVFAMSRGKFAAALENELKETDEDNLSFYDVTDDGRTLKVRFSDADFQGNKYLECTRIDFRERAAMDEEEVLGKVVDLDAMFNVPSYDDLKAKWLAVPGDEGEAEESEDTDETDEAPPARKPAKPGKPTRKREPEPEDEEPEADPDEEPESDADEEPEPPRRSKPGKPARRPEPEPEDEEPADEDPEDADPDEEPEDEPPARRSKPTRKREPEPEDEEPESDPDEDEDPEDEPPARTRGKPGASATSRGSGSSGKGGGGTSGGGKCPAGGTFGKDTDRFDGCDSCKLWDKCDAAKEAARKARKK